MTAPSFHLPSALAIARLGTCDTCAMYDDEKPLGCTLMTRADRTDGLFKCLLEFAPARCLAFDTFGIDLWSQAPLHLHANP